MTLQQSNILNFDENTILESLVRMQGEAATADLNHVDQSVELIRAAEEKIGKGQLALVSSFGAESAVLLHLVSKVDKNFPIFFLDTGKHFAETLAYVDQLTKRLRLTNVQFVSPDVQEITDMDPNGDLHATDPDSCCAIRKVNPLAKTLKNFGGWITGRKRFHGGGRANLPAVELDDGKIKLNPLVEWSADQIQDHFSNFGLPMHSLVDQGYRSIGCEACTERPDPNGDVRSGRWRGKSKFECGIHKAA